MRSNKLLLGDDIRCGEKLKITPKMRRTHMHILGSTGEGKSKLMEHMIRQDILQGNGLCLIDPHGSLYKDIVSWCAYNGMLDRGRSNKKILLLDPNDDNWSFGFNPLNAGEASISFFVDSMVKAVSMVWGGEDSNRTPLLKRCLRLIFHALVEQDLTLYEALHLINSEDKERREILTSNIKDVPVRMFWDELNSYSPADYRNNVSSTLSRLSEFLSSDRMCNIIGQKEHTIDFRKIMDEGGIVLVNLSYGERKISFDNAQALGALIVNTCFLEALGRDQDYGKRHPFYLYIDECSDYINEDVGKILDQTRKFGVHAILAHQNLEQLRSAGEKVFASVMENAKTKVVFGGLEYEDAQRMVNKMFTKDQINLQEPKEIMDKPVVIGHRKEYFRTIAEGHTKTSGTNWNTTEMETESEGEAENWGQQTTSAHTDSYSFAISRDFSGCNVQKTINYGSADVSGSGFSSGGGRQRGSSKGIATSTGGMEAVSDSKMEGFSERLVPILKWLPGQLYSLQEQKERAIWLMMEQPEQHCIIKLPKDESRFVTAPFVKGFKVRKRHYEGFVETSSKINDCVQKTELVKLELEERNKQIEDLVKKQKNPEEPKDYVDTTPPNWESLKRDEDEEVIEVKAKKNELEKKSLRDAMRETWGDL